MQMNKKSFNDVERNKNYQTLPRGWKSKNTRNVELDEKRITNNKYKDDCSSKGINLQEPRMCKVQPVQAFPRSKSNPFLVKTNAKESSYKEKTKNGSASDIYWANLETKIRSKEPFLAADASTQTKLDKKKRGCKII